MSQVGLGALLPLLLVLTSGWLVLRSRYGKTFVWWQSGYNLYFRIAFAGILCLAPGLMIATALAGFNLVDSSCASNDARVSLSFQTSSFSIQCQQEILALATWLTPLIGIIGHVAGNFWPKANSPRFINKQKSIVQKKAFEGYIKNTVEEHSFLLITLNNRKVYIGTVLEDSNLQFKELEAEEEKYLRVTMVLSGYRGDRDMRMHLTENYSDEELKTRMSSLGIPNTNLEMLIPVKEIASIQPFNPTLYRGYFMHSKGVGWVNPPQHNAPDSLS